MNNTTQELEHKQPLQDMIALKVFHLDGFNHYVAQFTDSGIDLYLNTHPLVSGIFTKKTKFSTLKSLNFAQGITVANLSLVHSSVTK